VNSTSLKLLGVQTWAGLGRTLTGRCEDTPMDHRHTDSGTQCEADLPESLRFGKVEVNCEGYSRAGDPFVLKGTLQISFAVALVLRWPRILCFAISPCAGTILPSQWKD
jgi:hypothetical protein